MESTLENKEKFFSQYWGQEIMYTVGKPNSYFKVNEINICGIEKEYLLLKPLSSITDEDATFVEHSESYISLQAAKDYIEEHTPLFNQLTVDYLRSKGYALPYMELSVKQLVEYGWIKLKTQ